MVVSRGARGSSLSRGGLLPLISLGGVGGPECRCVYMSSFGGVGGRPSLAAVPESFGGVGGGCPGFSSLVRESNA